MIAEAVALVAVLVGVVPNVSGLVGRRGRDLHDTITVDTVGNSASSTMQAQFHRRTEGIYNLYKI